MQCAAVKTILGLISVPVQRNSGCLTEDSAYQIDITEGYATEALETSLPKVTAFEVAIPKPSKISK